MHNTNSLQLADVLRAGFSRFVAATGPLPPQHYAVANAIMGCKTAALGGHVFKCDHCGHDKISYNSCRNRHCPSCQAQARAHWVEKRLDELLAVPYFHVVFTLPNALNPFALRNKSCMYNLLFRAASETLCELGRDPKRLGAELGFIALLHTWGQTLQDHPHLHCVVPAGGLRDDEWVASKSSSFLFPIAVMAKLFRGKFLDYFEHAVEGGDIEFHGQLRRYRDEPKLMSDLLDTLYRKQWVVYAKPPFAGPEAVVKYLGRYTHRIAIANSRLVSLDDTEVRFRWKDYADGHKQKVMALNIAEFIRRFLLHVLPKGFVRIRYYGFLSCRGRAEKLALCMSLTGKRRHTEPHAIPDAPHATQPWSERTWVCPLCNKGRMRLCFRIHKPDPGGTLSIAA
ncbi:MAG: IS91 family transposase [Chitinivibrionales bacterium]|nr:IS91 family transposase [Chitinivibrionales bacterium]MBD3396519.1 IS91 family transposase [Chitinivibrionales bacterium]